MVGIIIHDRPFQSSTRMAQQPDYSFVFVCQAGDLEIKAMLLAASLNRFVSCPYEMVVALPQPESRCGVPAAPTLRMLQDLGAKLAPVWNQVDPEYPIANKISAMAIATHGRRRIFLDTDIMCMLPFTGDTRLEAPFGAVPADRRTWGAGPGDWDRVYGLFGLTTPPVRVRTARTREETPPYYNAGFIMAESSVADSLAHTWLECAQVIDRTPHVPNKRPWLDQIALPVAVTRLGLGHRFLDETFNCPGDARLRSADGIPQFCHYHAQLAVKRLPVLNQLFRELVDQHPALRERVQRDRLWKDVLSPGFGLLDTLQTLKNARRRVAPPGTRRDELISHTAKRVRKVVGALRDRRR